ncbi:hypothetical protein [Thioclava nitratireducens]|uniref:hypothetical protein n=1 Tax=Thioclava nitratireducens TaxID=1915078 RepID=UPI0024814F2C|nr:hypothetical protein [Thioclava nitratireducens]WGT50423.1 hypothetical protein P0N61_19350 [Thioclava nitratireducens]
MNDKLEADMAKNPGGRPPNYLDAQLRDALEALLAAGIAEEDLTASRVTKELKKNGIEGEPNAASLRGKIALMLQQIKTEREDAYLSHVEESDDKQIDQVVGAIRRELRINVGRSRERHKKRTQEEIQGNRDRVESLEARISVLEDEVAAKDERISAYEEQERDWDADRTAMEEGLRKLEMECHSLREQRDLLERMGITGKSTADSRRARTQ